LQVLATTHSPVAVRELAAGQLNLVRRDAAGSHEVIRVGDSGNVQGPLRLFPEAFLAAKVIVC
jgi:putative ATP-dependent endonuclease of the OLD family